MGTFPTEYEQYKISKRNEISPPVCIRLKSILPFCIMSRLIYRCKSRPETSVEVNFKIT